MPGILVGCGGRGRCAGVFLEFKDAVEVQEEALFALFRFHAPFALPLHDVHMRSRPR
jgi:hypothetical protein